MDNLQSKLQRRVEKLNIDNDDTFLVYLQRLLKFLDSHPIFTGIIETLLAQYSDLETITDRIFCGREKLSRSEKKAAAVGYSVLRRLADSDNTSKLLNLGEYFHEYADPESNSSTIYSLFLLPFYEHIDEQIDDQRLMLNTLLRYKARSEWFYRNQLLSLMKNNSQKAEKLLALDFYSYLHDQGLDFTIEPSSLSGSIDIIAAQGTNDPLLADAKIFDADGRGKSYICKGFNQIYTYTQQYNEAFGYLLIFKSIDRDLCFSLPKKIANVPVVTYNHKSIFLITVDIYNYPDTSDPLKSTPVSGRKPLKAIEITEEDLIHFEEHEEVIGSKR